MQSELKAKETVRHIVDKFTYFVSDDGARGEGVQTTFPVALCGGSGGLQFHIVDWGWLTRPDSSNHKGKNFCDECVHEYERVWYGKRRQHKIPPVIPWDCEGFLRSIKDDISKTDDLEALAKLGDELRATSNRFYKTTVPTLLYEEQKGHCALCGEHQRNPKNMALSPIKARAKGGTSEIENLQLACRACNKEKGDRDNAEFVEYLKRSGRIVSASQE